MFYICIYIYISLSILSHEHSGASEARSLLDAKNDALGRPVGPFALTKIKNDEPHATFSRLNAGTWPPGLDFGSPGRSRARFWRPKRMDFRAFSPLAHVRCKLPATSKKYCKNQYKTHFGAFARETKNDKKSCREHVRQRLSLETRPNSALDCPGSVLGAIRPRF